LMKSKIKLSIRKNMAKAIRPDLSRKASLTQKEPLPPP
jgi:hypothetical protein